MADTKSELAALVAQLSGVPSQDDLMQRVNALAVKQPPFNPTSGPFQITAPYPAPLYGEEVAASGLLSPRELAAHRSQSGAREAGAEEAERVLDEQYAEAMAEQDAAQAASDREYVTANPSNQFEDAYTHRPAKTPHKINQWSVDFPIGDRERPISERPILGFDADGDTPIYDMSTRVIHPKAQTAADVAHMAGYMVPGLGEALALTDIGHGAATGNPLDVALAPLGLISKVGKAGSKLAGAQDVMRSGIRHGTAPGLALSLSAADAAEAGPLDDVAKPWFSRALKASERLSQPRATATQYMNTMLNAGNVSKEELEWALKNTPRDQQMALDEFRKQLALGVPQPDEVLKGSGKFGTRDAAEWQRDIDAAEEAGDWDAAEALQREWEGLGADGSTRNMTAYGEYQLPGGSNYKELLITLPRNEEANRAASARFLDEMQSKYGTQWYGRMDEKETAEHARLLSASSSRQQDGRLLRGSSGRQDDISDYVGPHFNEKGVLAHLRMNDREAKTYTPEMIDDIGRRLSESLKTAPEHLASGAPSVGVQRGVITPLEAAQFSDARGFRNVDTTGAHEKILHLEEVQSDLHQTGKKQGYVGEPPSLTPEQQARRKELDDRVIAARDHGGTPLTPAERDEYFALQPGAAREEGLVPNAPLKKDWPEMAFKRAVKYAADNGYDRITWTTGAQQLDRYPGLRTTADTVSYAKDGDGKWLVSLRARQRSAHGGSSIKELEKHALDDKELEAYVGKEVADRIRRNVGHEIGAPPGSGELRGEDILVGKGRGMPRFYDDQLPRVASKIGKKHGAKYETYWIEDEASNTPIPGRNIGGHQVHSLKLTPEMIKDAREKGMPFMAAAPAAALPAASDESAPDADLASKIDALEKRGYADGGRVGTAARVLDAITGDALSSVAKKRVKKPAKTPVVSDRETIDELARYLERGNGDPSLTQAAPYEPVNPNEFSPGSLHRQLAEGLVPNQRTGNLSVPFSGLMKSPDELRAYIDALQVTDDPRYAKAAAGNIADLKGQYLVPLYGDRSRAGWLHGYKDVELDEPVHMGGGHEYALGEGQGAWASNKGPVTALTNSIKSADAPVHGVYFPMSGEGTDFTQMQTDAVLAALRQSAPSARVAREFDAAFRASKEAEAVSGTYPGLRSADLDEWLTKAGNRRYALMKVLDKKVWTDAGLPDVSAARMAITHPALRGLPSGNESYGGQLVVPIGTDVVPTSTLPIGHATYPYDISRRGSGWSLETPVPRSAVFRDWYERRRALGKAESKDNKSFMATTTPQKVDDELIERVNEHIEQSKKEGPIDELLNRYESGGRVGALATATKPLSKTLLKAFKDWKWRTEREVADEIGVDRVPEHVEDFGRFMAEQAERARHGDLGARDLIKAYGITTSSIGRRAVDADLLRAAGHPTTQTGPVRPEGAMGDWLMSPAGQAYLDDAERRIVNTDALDNLRAVSAPFGKQHSLARHLEYAANELPPRADEMAAHVASGSAEGWRDYAKTLDGVGPAKVGFVGSLLGNGALPTLDARQIILHTGMPTREATKLLSRKGWGDQAVDRLADRQSRMGLRLDPSLEDFRQHLTHHTVWDKVADEKTTHADLIRAMRLAGVAPAAALGATTMGADEAAAAEPTLDDLRTYLSDGGE